MKRTQWTITVLVLAIAMAVVGAKADFHASDPGVRQGAAGAGGPRDGLTQQQLQTFTQVQATFQEVDDVPGGLGPGYNSRSCAACHAAPGIGGSSPAVNPQIEDATAGGALNLVPSFITINGPVREARFVKNANGTADGGVHDLYSIAGRGDAGGCNLQQPAFQQQLDSGNVVFRIPTPTFGAGFLEEISDGNIAAQAVLTPAKKLLGVAGRTNNSGNTGNVTRFGWKGQNPSLAVFAGEAYNVEQGVTNDNFPEERNLGPTVTGCVNATPEDTDADVAQFATFMKMLKPPQPVALTDSAVRGQILFSAVGCATCHNPTLRTGAKSSTTGEVNAAFSPYSDLLIHHMGTGLADGVGQGSAGADEFRTAPLWGVGQRGFFLHDGRCRDLLCAIQQHASKGSEARVSEAIFENLSEQQKQHLVDFLRSL